MLLGEQPRRAVDVERVLDAALEVGEGARDLGEEAALGLAQLGVGEAVGDHPRAEREPAERAR